MLGLMAQQQRESLRMTYGVGIVKLRSPANKGQGNGVGVRVRVGFGLAVEVEKAAGISATREKRRLIHCVRCVHSSTRCPSAALRQDDLWLSA